MELHITKGFTAFGQQPQFQHQMGQNQPQYPQQQQPHFQGQPVIGQGQPMIGQGQPVIGQGQPVIGQGQPVIDQGMQQPGPQFSSPFQQQYQQAGMGMGMGPVAPVQQTPAADVDPFKELAEGGSNGATGDNSGQESVSRETPTVVFKESCPSVKVVLRAILLQLFLSFAGVAKGFFGKGVKISISGFGNVFSFSCPYFMLAILRNPRMWGN